MTNLELNSEIDRILTRQTARLLEFLDPVNPPDIIKEAIRKYFMIAKKDLINYVEVNRNVKSK